MTWEQHNYDIHEDGQLVASVAHLEDGARLVAWGNTGITDPAALVESQKECLDWLKSFVAAPWEPGRSTASVYEVIARAEAARK